MKIKIKDRERGFVFATIDREDRHLFNEYVATTKPEYSRVAPTYVVLAGYNGLAQAYAGRAILESHQSVPANKNVKYIDGNPLNLCKKNLQIGRKAKGKD